MLIELNPNCNETVVQEKMNFEFVLPLLPKSGYIHA